MYIFIYIPVVFNPIQFFVRESRQIRPENEAICCYFGSFAAYSSICCRVKTSKK